MKVLRVLGLALFLTMGIVAHGQNTLPSVKLKTLDGKNTDLISFADNGKITVICIWITWVTPSTKELDVLAELYADWQKKYNMELVAISMDTPSQLDKVYGLVEARKWPFTILVDADNQLRSRLGVEKLPQTLIVNTLGEIILTHTGFSSGDEMDLEEQLKQLRGQ